MIFTDPSMINEDHTELINTYKEQVENNMLNRNQDHINNNVLLNKIIDQIEIKKNTYASSSNQLTYDLMSIQ